MDQIQSTHPDPDQLAAFARGRVPEERAAAISLHLADCGTCRTAVDCLPEDTLLGLLRQPPESDAAMPTGPLRAAPIGDQVLPELAEHPRYQVLELLDAGGMGAVYKARHRLMERPVALKVINPDLMKRPAMVERFQREVKAAARLAHANIVTAYDADQAGDTHFLVMEFVEGIGLAQWVQQLGRLPIREACTYVCQAALGLQHAFERGMVHRDIKPHNLMRTPEGQVKILDFGLARLVRESASAGTETAVTQAEAIEADTPGLPGRLTDAGAVMGTADFIAPEQANDPRQADIRADIYSLGCTLYYLLAGHGPFPEGTALDKLAAHRERLPAPLRRLRGDVPADLVRVVERMMAKDPAERYQTPAEVAEALARFVRPPSALRRFVVAAASLFAAALLAGGLIYVYTDKGEFIIEAEDDNVAFMVNQKGIKIQDRAANREYQLKVGKQNVRTGDYAIDVQELPDGVEFAAKTFTLKRGDKVTAVARFKRKDDVGFLQEEGLRWFPAQATFFGGRDMRAFPELSVQQILVLTQLIGMLDPRDREMMQFVSFIGRIDRITFAYALDREQPAKSRIFIRATGLISHERLIEWFRQHWPGATIGAQTGAQGEPITLISSSQGKAPAFGLVGKTDLIVAAYQGFGGNHMAVVHQVLDLRAGRGASLPGPWANELQRIPVNAWTFMMGEPPEASKNLLIFRVLPRKAVFAISGTKNLHAQFHGSFPTAAEANAFVDHVTWLKQQGKDFLKNPPVKINPQAAELLATTLGSLRMEAADDRVEGGVHLSSETVDALIDTIHDLPFSLLNKLIRPPSLNGTGVRTKP
jgi:tRNA A-37 threonylcarbamoyl transferase component Bud32